MTQKMVDLAEIPEEYADQIFENMMCAMTCTLKRLEAGPITLAEYILLLHAHKIFPEKNSSASRAVH